MERRNRGGLFSRRRQGASPPPPPMSAPAPRSQQYRPLLTQTGNRFTTGPRISHVLMTLAVLLLVALGTFFYYSVRVLDIDALKVGGIEIPLALSSNGQSSEPTIVAAAGLSTPQAPPAPEPTPPPPPTVPLAAKLPEGETALTVPVAAPPPPPPPTVPLAAKLPEGETPLAVPVAAPPPGLKSAPRATAAPTPTPEPVLRPDQRHLELKEHMLTLVNDYRRNAGLQPVVLGDNIAAQLHAELSLADCTARHWGTDGLKPYMRYTLAGGFQSNAENMSGHHYCIKSWERYAPLNTSTGGLIKKVSEAVEIWMGSPGHRRAILDSHYRKLNVGLAWDSYNFVAVQHFEGDYVDFSQLPNLKDGILISAGNAKNGVQLEEDADLGVLIAYDPPPTQLTPGQLAQTYCYDYGVYIAGLLFPLPEGEFWTDDSFTQTTKPCLSPYNVPPDTPPPQSVQESHRVHDIAKEWEGEEISLTVPWVTASTWQVSGGSFQVEADIGMILEEHGPGVYTIMVRGMRQEEPVWIAEYSIFHDVTPPTTYDPGNYPLF